MKPICIDANVFIASTKGNETYSSDCRRVIQAVAGDEYYLIEPTICLTEVIRNITKYLGIEAGKILENNLRGMEEQVEIEVYHLQDFSYHNYSIRARVTHHPVSPRAIHGGRPGACGHVHEGTEWGRDIISNKYKSLT